MKMYASENTDNYLNTNAIYLSNTHTHTDTLVHTYNSKFTNPASIAMQRRGTRPKVKKK